MCGRMRTLTPRTQARMSSTPLRVSTLGGSEHYLKMIHGGLLTALRVILVLFRITHLARRYNALASAGIASQSRPSSSRPFAFFVRRWPSGPQFPHCLKKKSTPCSEHWRCTSRTQSIDIGRAFGPDSPPTITQSMPVRSSSPTFSSKGSTLRKRVLAGAD